MFLGFPPRDGHGGIRVKSFKILPTVAVLFAILSIMAGGAFAAPAKNTAKAKPATRTAVAKPETTFTEIWAGRKPPFDSGKVRRYYLDGDFEEAIEILETAIKEKRPMNHADSVFYCKHLGVMYAAKYETREKGKYYMHQLLQVEPTARILDMYASDMIYMIFKSIQDEFDVTRMRLGRAEKNWKGSQDSMPVAKTPEPKPAPKEGKSNTLFWVGATTAVVGTGVAAYFIFGDSPETRKVDGVFPQ